MICSGFRISTSGTRVISFAFTSFGPLMSKIIFFGLEEEDLIAKFLTFNTMSVTSSLTPLIDENSIPELLREKPKLKCVVGLTVEPKRLIDVRKNRMMALKEEHGTDYTNIEKIELETKNAKQAFKKYKQLPYDNRV